MITSLLMLSGLLLAGILAANMLRPRFTKKVVSAAKFFMDLPPAKEARSRLRLSNPARSRPLYFQLLMLVLLVVALLLYRANMRGMTRDGVALWILIDTSASMDTKAGSGGRRLDLAIEKARRSIASAEKVAEDLELRIRISGYDLEINDVVNTQSAAKALSALDTLKVRSLGTDLSIVSEAIAKVDAQNQSDEPEDLDFRFTHLHIISDQSPRPQPAKNVRVIWENIGKPANNQGIIDIQPNKTDPITALIREISVTCEYHGEQAGAQLSITAPKGHAVPVNELRWKRNGKAVLSFPVEDIGLYRVALNSASGYKDSYNWDNRAAFYINETKYVKADWQLADKNLMGKINWKQSSDRPDIRIVSFTGSSSLSKTPTIYVGRQVEKAGTGQSTIKIFENHPLIHTVDFDAFDQEKIPGIPLPKGFKPALAGGPDSETWLAYRDKPAPAVYIPGVPMMSTNRAGIFSDILFVNSVRWLLGLNSEAVEPLYKLTDVGHPEPSDNRVVLHPGEGDTSSSNATSSGSSDDIRRASLGTEKIPVWPSLLSLCALVFLIERGMAAYGSSRWR
ncbi:MAG: VWA domain-containing protein [Opitutae bacterium]|jgi:hypothetical protein|nr:VWA domain-containing protein [Opitutae bacterium]MBT6957011.1 VWA domain-containing protein [Opitutae bacterium]